MFKPPVHLNISLSSLGLGTLLELLLVYSVFLPNSLAKSCVHASLVESVGKILAHYDVLEVIKLLLLELLLLLDAFSPHMILFTALWRLRLSMLVSCVS